MVAQKDWRTTKLRRTILHGSAAFLLETDRADLLLVTLSFQSRVKSERHIWIDTDRGDSADRFSIDLEDWTYEATWDNAVATVETTSRRATRDITWAWLRGETLDHALAQSRDLRIERK
jgi:hypothetical protein